jgi:hypothetical protein
LAIEADEKHRAAGREIARTRAEPMISGVYQRIHSGRRSHPAAQPFAVGPGPSRPQNRVGGLSELLLKPLIRSTRWWPTPLYYGICENAQLDEQMT